MATSLGQLTEVVALPGLGKTQLCIQLTASVLLNRDRVIYIDTEGSFTIGRLLQMSGSNINTNDVRVYRILSIAQLISLIQELETILLDFENVKLIIIDSIAFMFRGISDYGQRSMWLNNIAQELKKIAYEKEILVVLTNQMTTKIQNNGGVLVPALGESWGHVCNNRIFLFWKDGIRRMYLAKSSMSKEKTWDFWISSKGIESSPCD